MSRTKNVSAPGGGDDEDPRRPFRQVKGKTVYLEQQEGRKKRRMDRAARAVAAAAAAAVAEQAELGDQPQTPSDQIAYRVRRLASRPRSSTPTTASTPPPTLPAPVTPAAPSTTSTTPASTALQIRLRTEFVASPPGLAPPLPPLLPLHHPLCLLPSPLLRHPPPPLHQLPLLLLPLPLPLLLSHLLTSGSAMRLRYDHLLRIPSYLIFSVLQRHGYVGSDTYPSRPGYRLRGTLLQSISSAPGFRSPSSGPRCLHRLLCECTNFWTFPLFC
jgi:hypothetical protein